MKHFAGCLLLYIAGSVHVQAQPANVYRTLPDPSFQLVTVNRQTIIQDSRGFFVGYYRPLPPAAAPFVPQAKPQGVWAGISNNRFPGYGYNNGYTTGNSYGGYSDYSGSDSNDCSGSGGSDGRDCGSASSASTGSAYSDPGGSPLCSPDYGFGR